MCLNCGCWRPGDSHGDPANLTLAGLAAAAAAGGTTVQQAAWNIPATLSAASTPAWPPVLEPLTTHPTLVWDVDGTLSFTAEVLCAALNARYGTVYDVMTQQFFPGRLVPTALPADQAAWLAGELTGFTLYQSCAPDWRAVDTMTAASDAGYPTVIVTERHPALAVHTQQWLAGWDVKTPPVTAVGPGNKPAYLATRYGPGNPAVLVDDNPLTMLTVARPGIDVWLPARPYTPRVVRDHCRVIGSWPLARFWLGLGPQP
jgi:hypothetical protein